MQALCGLQGIFDLFNCKTPDSILCYYKHERYVEWHIKAVIFIMQNKYNRFCCM